MNNRETIFSPCRRYRYTLWRRVPVTFNFEERDGRRNALQVIGLNPSTADEKVNDPTVRRCIDFASRWGFSWMCMTNLFGYRATDPRDMQKQKDPFGDDNFTLVQKVAEECDMILCAWGAHPRMCGIDKIMLDMLEPQKEKFRHLGLTKNGKPRHPLYVQRDTKPQQFI